MEEQYMRRAIELAKNGSGFTNPNPLVGAVIVKDGRIIGEGWHERCGGLHAERNALKNCTESPAGATMYVTLEPCAHYGRQPPCTAALIESGIRTVVIGSRDPNRLVHGKGAAQLRAHGMTVYEDFMRAQCDRLNPIFFHYITTGLPYVIVKYAASLDGRIAGAERQTLTITGEAAHRAVHETRKRVAAVMVGIGTAEQDDPMLNCRTAQPSQPVRVVLDSHLRIGLQTRLVQTAQQLPLRIYCTDAAQEKRRALTERGAEVLTVPAEQDGRVSIQAVLQDLGSIGIDSVLIEGGQAVLTSVLRQDFAQEIQVYLAPSFVGAGGTAAVGALPAPLILPPDFLPPEAETFDRDMRLTYRRRTGAELCLQD